MSKLTIFIPFLDHLQQEFEKRFSQLSQDAMKGFHLVPKLLSQSILLCSIVSKMISIFQSRSEKMENAMG